MKNPFVGLRPFRSAEDNLFFGRTRDIAVLQNLVMAMPVVVVYAPSGTGKSSLINAGLIPIIKRDPTLFPIVITDPHDNVVQTVREKLASVGWIDSAEPGGTGAGLVEVLERHFDATDRRVVLVLDQFEQRLKQRKAVEALYAEIAYLANTRSDAVAVVISIREDYLAGLENLMRRVTGLLDSSYRVPSLSRSALADAVHGPLKVVGVDVTVDDGLIEEVLTDLERQPDSSEALGGGMLVGHTLDGRIEAGYFQIVWSHLWEKDIIKTGSRLTRSTYQHEGCATGILRSFVSDTLSQLLPLEAEVLRAAIRYMVLPTGAKVALTVNDLLGLLRADEFTALGRTLLLSATDTDDKDLLPVDDRQIIGQILESVFQQLTRTDAPIFRRVVRAGREEFELIHDLLGLILLQWRLQYESHQSSAMDQVANAVTVDRERKLLGQASRIARASVPHMLSRAKDLFELYSHNLKTAETTDDAENNTQVLRSGFSEIGTVALTQGAPVQVTDEVSRTLDIVWQELRAAAVRSGSRDVRRIVQQQAIEFIAMKDRLVWRYQYYGSTGRWVVLRNLVAGVLSLALAVGGIYLAHWLIQLVWQVPDIQYAPLTFGFIAVAASLLYTFCYGEIAGDRFLDGAAIQGTLWPTGAELPTASKPTAILTWWPIHYLILELGLFGGAALFQLAGWSATAGFNVAAVFLPILLAIFHVTVVDP
jgi:hypothetical protein